MSGLLARLRPHWQVQRKRRPALVGRAEDVVLASRGRDALLVEVRSLRTRLAELERDHLLLAAHVATLSEGRAAVVGPLASDDADARQRARLTAIAFYEERIGALEEAVRNPRHAGGRRGRASIGRTSAEQEGRR